MENRAKGKNTIESRGKINFAPEVPPNSHSLIGKLREQDIQRTIIAWLRLKRYFFWRQNNGAMVKRSQGHNRYIRFGTPGAPDIFVVRKVKVGNPPFQPYTEAQIWGIECKSPRGSQSVDQRAFEAAFRDAGGYYLVAKSLDDVTEVLG